MIDDARAHLHQLLNRLLWPSETGARWFHGGQEQVIQSPAALRRALSQIMEAVFPETPRILNDLIVRQRPSAVVVNARKRLLMGMLERSGEETLGVVGNFPDASMRRTVLVATGLYRKGVAGWGYAKPEDLRADPGLRSVWKVLSDFFTKPSDEPKGVKQLLDQLGKPPYGVRAGLLPILFTAAFKAFPRVIALSRDGRYVTDILPTEVEQLCREPERYSVRVLGLDPGRREYLLGFAAAFGVAPRDAESTDVIRLAYEALEGWKAALPPGVWSTRELPEHALLFRDTLAKDSDPHSLILRQVPRALGDPDLRDAVRVLSRITQCRGELESVTRRYQVAATETLRRSFGVAEGDLRLPLLEAAKRWAGFLRNALPDQTDGVAKALVSRADGAYETEAKLLDSVSSLLLGKTLDRWDDSTVVSFEREVVATVRRVEEVAISGASDAEGAAGEALAGLVQTRVRQLYGKLVDLLGESAAEQFAGPLTTRGANGHSPRSARGPRRP